MHDEFDLDQVRDSIHRAWVLRVGQDPQAAGELILKVGQAFDLPSESPDLAHISRHMDPLPAEDVVQYLAIQSTLHRWRGSRALALKYFERGEELAAEAHLSSFFLYHEKTQYLLAEGEYHKSMKFGLEMQRLAETDLQKLVARTLLLVAMENMGLDCTQVAGEIRELLQGQPREALYEIFHQNLFAFEQRQAFRSGRFSWVNEPDKEESVIGQDTYYKAWAKRLPYHIHFTTKLSPSLEAYSRNSLEFPLKWYRLRTVLGLNHPEDTKHFLWYELSDRFYLWLWTWLRTFEDSDREKLLGLLKCLQGQELPYPMTCEDSHMFGNGVLWLGLLSNSEKTRIYRRESRLRQGSLDNFPLLRFERLFIKYCFEKRSKNFEMAERILRQAKSEELWASPEFLLPRLWKAILGEELKVPVSLQALFELLEDVVDHRSNKAPVLVDLRSWQVSIEGQNPVLRSEPLSRALEIFSRVSSIACDDFFQSSFGFNHYDPYLHQSKLYNLLSRIKRLTGFEFSIKENVVSFGGSSEDISVAGRATYSLGLSGHPAWMFFLESLVGEPSQSFANKSLKLRQRNAVKGALNLTWEKGLSRKEIQEGLGLSRSTSIRWLNQKLSDGVLEKRGQGRATRYVPKDERARQILEESL